jgi:deoxyribodipyrimidine photo-lyase
LDQSLEELDADLRRRGGRLFRFFGEAEDVIGQLLEKRLVDAVYFNRDYTPFSRLRDDAIMHISGKYGAHAVETADALLQEPGACLKADGTPYTVFSPYFRKSASLPVTAPQILERKNFGTDALEGEAQEERYRPFLNEGVLGPYSGGRKAALSILGNLRGFQGYAVDRDFPAKSKTTTLSAHLKFGTCSIREAHVAATRDLGTAHPLLRQLYWRDFFTHVAANFPRVFGRAFLEKYDNIQWEEDPKLLQCWMEGQTGFPIVDAGMRQLNATGFMHNRVRMIVASFLCKDLQLDWRAGEKYFATKLVDYDPCVNNGNWQWAASTGCDAQPYFRVFNPWLQQKKFDPDASYIKRWVPELQDLTPSQIHRLGDQRTSLLKGYPEPVVDHNVARISAVEKYAAAVGLQERERKDLND